MNKEYATNRMRQFFRASLGAALAVTSGWAWSQLPEHSILSTTACGALFAYSCYYTQINLFREVTWDQEILDYYTSHCMLSCVTADLCTKNDFGWTIYIVEAICGFYPLIKYLAIEDIDPHVEDVMASMNIFTLFYLCFIENENTWIGVIAVCGLMTYKYLDLLDSTVSIPKFEIQVLLHFAFIYATVEALNFPEGPTTIRSWLSLDDV